jgi:putative glutathione S-transferase
MPLTPPPLAANYTGGYVRQQSAFTGRVSADGSTRYPAEPGRYQLYASLACPWSQRAVIVRRLLGLEQVIGLTLADPVTSEHGWRFPAADGGRDHVTGASFVAELYHATDPGYGGWCTLPLLWDTRTGQIVSNDAAQITVMLETAFAGFHRPGSPDLYPPAQRREIEAVGALVFSTVNNGVYKAGLAATQAQYEEAFDALFTTLAALEERLSRRRFLLGGQPTEADIRLYPALARFDAVYYLHFKCNLRRLVDYQSLWVRPGSVPAAGFRGNHGLRPDQAALLPVTDLDQPVQDRAQRAFCQLAGAARQRPSFGLKPLPGRAEGGPTAR